MISANASSSWSVEEPVRVDVDGKRRSPGLPKPQLPRISPLHEVDVAAVLAEPSMSPRDSCALTRCPATIDTTWERLTGEVVSDALDKSEGRHRWKISTSTSERRCCAMSSGECYATRIGGEGVGRAGRKVGVMTSWLLLL